MAVLEDVTSPPAAGLRPRGVSQRERWQRRLPLLPALIYTIVVTQVPFIVTLYYSFQNYFWNQPGGATWAGVSNYKEVFTDPNFRSALWRSVTMTALAVIFAMTLGIALAVLLDKKFIGRGVVRTLIITPFLVMPAAAALIWAGPMLDPNFGLLNYLLEPFGVNHVAWLTTHAYGSVIVVMVWQWTPFMTLIVLAGLQGQAQDALEAARVDGANAWAIFRELTLPHLRPYIELGILLGSIYLVNVFDQVRLMTNGGPGTSTTTLPFYIYQKVNYAFDIGGSAAAGVVTVVLTIIVASFALRLFARVFQFEEGAMTATTALTATDGPAPGPVQTPKRSRRVREIGGLAGWTVLGWVVGIAFFLPILWMFLTAFKPEASAETWPPKFTFSPTLAEFRLVFNGATPVGPFLEHSAIATVGSTILVLVLALPASYALSIRPVGKWRDSLFFFISTKMLPIVAAIGPLYVIALKTHLLDSIWLLIILYAAMNLPLAIWMIRSFMLEVPAEMLEAARLDGAGRFREITEVIMPVVSPGLVSTALICVIFAWNELFLALNLTVTNAATMPMFLISSVPQEGLYIAHLSAAATVASVPVILVGWIAQRSLVRGLSMGAIK